jgi:hypothetical protein
VGFYSHHPRGIRGAGMNQDIQLATLVAGTIIPAVIGLITSVKASPVLQTTLGAVMSVMVGLASTWSFSGQFNWVTAGIAILTTFISTLVLTHSLYHQTGAMKKIQGVTDGIAVDKVIANAVGSAHD